jgi:hypothetical protein
MYGLLSINYLNLNIRIINCNLSTTEKWDPGDTDVETKFSIKFKESVKQDEGLTISIIKKSLIVFFLINIMQKSENF